MAYRQPLPGGGQPQSNHTRAGAGLNTAEAQHKFGGAAEVGASGERYFAQVLKREGLDGVFDIFYSLSLPRGGSFGNKRYDSDVDVVLVNGNRIVLLDVKRWKGAKFYWSLGGMPFEGLVPLSQGGKTKLSANMAAAVRRYKEALPGVSVSAMVVFVPTHRGVAPASVRFLKWPGGIRSFQVPAAVRELKTRLGVQRQVPAAKTIGLLNSLQRGA